MKLFSELRLRAKPLALSYMRSRRPDEWWWGERVRFSGRIDEPNPRIFGELREPQLLHITADVPMGNVVTRNADVVIWGKAAGDG